jgi:O-methyltransferase
VGFFLRVVKQVVKMIVLPMPVAAFLRPAVGRDYSLGMLPKVRLLFRVLQNSSRLGSASTFYEQLTIVQAILDVPRGADGVVAEFGCYKGWSTASLSLACRATGRRLVVFDSFEGLPPPAEMVTGIETGSVVQYRRGDYAGALEEVRRNVARGGDIDSCEFVKGYFDDTLPQRDPRERYVLVFEDADLPESVRAVVSRVWSRLYPGGRYFCHEARDFEVVRLFFDNLWWQQTAGGPAPGFVGSGVGLPLDPRGSMLGYAVKLNGRGPQQ